jgi:hypothetical protein
VSNIRPFLFVIVLLFWYILLYPISLSMSLKHQLSLEVPDTNNTKVFRVTDTSIYTDSLEIKCPTLQITSPGFKNPVTIDVIAEFNLVLNACTLGITTGDCSNSPSIPDGIYYLKYSVSPNDKVYVEYYHLRVTQTLNIYYNALCDVELSACEPDDVTKARLEELRLIRSYIDAAKIKVEEAHELSKGMQLLLYAKKLLTKYVKDC